MTLFPGSVHESAPTNTIILSPHPGADSACAAHSLVSRADVSLRAFQTGCSRSPPSCRVAGRRTHVCACVHAMQTCVHTSVLTLEHGQLQAGRQASRLRLPFRLPAHGLLANFQSWFAWGWVLFPTMCWGGGVTSLHHQLLLRERGEEMGRGGSLDSLPRVDGAAGHSSSQGLGGVLGSTAQGQHFLPGGSCWEEGAVGSRGPCNPEGSGALLSWPPAPGRCRQPGRRLQGLPGGRSAALVLTSGTRPEGTTFRRTCSRKPGPLSNDE